MTRPCFLVIEREYPGNISARKLVIETAKMNVITCYSSAEGIATLRRFPTVDGIVLSADVKDIPCAIAAQELKSMRPETPLIVISPSGQEPCDVADRRVSSHDPQALLDVLKEYAPATAA
jgi:hypothetical protein